MSLVVFPPRRRGTYHNDPIFRLRDVHDISAQIDLVFGYKQEKDIV
jgi:hypothetical protein